jgi:hypothetical protein
MTITFFGYKLTIERCKPIVCDSFSIQVNEKEREKMAGEIIETEFFMDLQHKAKMIRQQRLQNAN